MRSDTDPVLSPSEARELRRIAGLMIPASDEFRVPGADDPIIFADLIRSIDRDLADVRTALAQLRDMAGQDFTELDAVQAEIVAKRFLARDNAQVTALGRAVLLCYYRDDRVLEALGLEARAPFPKGHTLEQGDWSLLDAVRGRPRMWRDDRGHQNGG